MNFSYRADIDGLRAIAVLLVIFNHVGLSFFSGGYIGVDVFFVISGYLITIILTHDIQSKRFSIARFYKKRVVRLAPAYFTVLSVVSIIAWQVMLPGELTEYFDSVMYATLLMANIYMRNEVGDYFSQDAEGIPLLHLWSLGVEEQFYIFWPLLLLLFAGKVSRKYMWAVVTAFIVALLLYAQHKLTQNAAKAYYSMPVRAFELLIGALIGFLPQLKLPKKLLQSLIWGGLVVLFATAVYFDKQTPFPGAMALIPCLATALIIYLGQSSPSSNILLSNRFSTWVGRISYPLYLWHWPIIVLFGIYMRPLNVENQVVIVLLSILLAFLTYQLIEKPSKRFVMAANYKVIVIGFLMPALSFIAIAKTVNLNEGFPDRFPQSVYSKQEAMLSYAHVIRNKCMDIEDPKALPDQEDCVLGKPKADIDFLLIGDSHANGYSAMLDVWAKDANLRGYDITQSSTFYLPGVQRSEANFNRWTKLDKFAFRNEAITAHLAKTHYPTIILAGSYVPYFGDEVKLEDGKHHSNAEIFKTGFMKALEIAYQSSDQVILLNDVPRLDRDGVPADCNLRNEILNTQAPCTVSRKNYEAQLLQFNRIVAEAKQKYPDLKIIDPTRVICNQQACKIMINDVPLYRNKDSNHINDQGSRQLGIEYLKQFGNPLKD
ncbi:acyltransferase [Acinetobacter sp. ANC 4216]|uniref:acyltransferase family protein n=1 Tax=unclassified Acinetobacter TaxID=196816 RepID=UPI0010405191|nr:MULTISPECIES: acyltransferase family protein [unclassified Acinetobacter]MCT8088833.1 acyltransferase [Acinetobacter sp. F_3_1]MCT8096989.1 acyltransferase [Acinetobacter sp. C_3_1]MCT8100018.1 acyltransferase [Acinetobacter sp. C_4_1]MCT8134416.1 acyltransferase [Acinetobacter sp. T_3_1]TCB69279.1 acyltransferase [Acinetobacter sp. ANC 4216]